MLRRQGLGWRGPGLVVAGVGRTSQNPAARREVAFVHYVRGATREKSSICILWFRCAWHGLLVVTRPLRTGKVVTVRHDTCIMGLQHLATAKLESNGIVTDSNQLAPSSAACDSNQHAGGDQPTPASSVPPVAGSRSFLHPMANLGSCLSVATKT